MLQGVFGGEVDAMLEDMKVCLMLDVIVIVLDGDIRCARFWIQL